MEKEVERTHYLRKAIIAFIIATILFVGVFLLGYTVSYNKYQEISRSQEDLRYSLLSFEIEKAFLNDSCNSFNPYKFSEDMSNMGEIIDLLEERLGKEDINVLNQKKTYSLLEARHFLYILEHNEKCSNQIPVILLFYSNQGDYKFEAEKLGFMLSNLKKTTEVMIYSFDFDLNSDLVNLLKERYNIAKPNMLVINERTSANGFKTVEEIREQIN